MKVEGFKDVVVYNDPIKAIEYLKTNSPDLIISDFLMPEMNGMEFLREAKKLYPETSMILLTAYADKENAIKTINEIGVYKYIEKPWVNDDLVMNIRNGIERSHLLSDLRDKIEELEHAKKRGAKIYAEIIGYGATSDAYHITSPEPTGDGAARAIKRAIEDANIKPEDIDYINAHGTSTHLNDVCETMAIKKALGENVCKKLMVSSTKGNTGHLLGAAGAIEAIFSIKAIENKIVPPTINYKEKDEECDLDIVPNEIRKKDLKIVMSNSLGFGGHNGSVIFKEYEE